LIVNYEIHMRKKTNGCLRLGGLNPLRGGISSRKLSIQHSAFNIQHWRKNA